jgi:hypothetical protein
LYNLIDNLENGTINTYKIDEVDFNKIVTDLEKAGFIIERTKEPKRDTVMGGMGNGYIDLKPYYTIKQVMEFYDNFDYVNGGSLMEVHNGTAFMDNPIYADNGLMLDNNDGFMKADNNRNFRYPEKEVIVEVLNEDIDLNDNVSYLSKEVYVQPLSEDISINEIGRIRATLGYVDKNRTPAKLLDMNPRAAEYVVIDEMADGGSIVHYPSFKISKGTLYLDSFLNPGYYSY